MSWSAAEVEEDEDEDTMYETEETKSMRDLLDIDVETKIRRYRQNFADFTKEFFIDDFLRNISEYVEKLNENANIMSCIYGGRAWHNFSLTNSEVVNDYNEIAFIPGNLDIMIVIDSSNETNWRLFNECRENIKFYMSQIVNLYEAIPNNNQIKQLYELNVNDTIGENFKQRTFLQNSYGYLIELQPRNLLKKNRKTLNTRTIDWFGNTKLSLFYCELGWQPADIKILKSIFFTEPKNPKIFPSAYGLFIINSAMGKIVRKDKGINIDKMRRNALKQSIYNDNLAKNEKMQIQDLLFNLIQTFFTVFEPKNYIQSTMLTYLFENYDALINVNSELVNYNDLEKILMNHSLNNTPLRKLLQIMIVMLRNSGYNIAVSGGDALQRYINIPLSDIDTKMTEPHKKGKMAVFMALCVLNQIINTNLYIFGLKTTYSIHFGSYNFSLNFNTENQTYFSLVRALFKFYVPLISLTLRYNYNITYKNVKIIKSTYAITPFDCAFVKKRINIQGGMYNDGDTIETPVMTYNSLYEDLIHTHETFSTKLGRNFADKVEKDYQRIEQLNALETKEITRPVGQMSLDEIRNNQIFVDFMNILYVLLTDDEFLIKLEQYVPVLSDAYSEFTIAEHFFTNIEYKLKIQDLTFNNLPFTMNLYNSAITLLTLPFYVTTIKNIDEDFVKITNQPSKNNNKTNKRSNIIVKRTNQLETVLKGIQKNIKKTVKKNTTILHTPVQTRSIRRNLSTSVLLNSNKLKTLKKYLKITKKK